MGLMIEDLMDPSVYPEATKKVEFVQTHISSVFICDKFVYKIKKPVNFGFLDFSTLEKRKFYCEKEVELNNRFSKGVYLGVDPITYDNKKYRIKGKGETVDYAVKMKKLSDEDLFKTRLKKGKITGDDLFRIVRSIADFHKKAQTSEEISKFGRVEVLKVTTDENFIQTEEFIGNSITQQQYDDLKNWTNEFYVKYRNLFDLRMKNGKIRDCHGDLHMEHICLTDPVIIFDCIEFNERFRYVDIISDFAFLLMDLDFNGADMMSRKLLLLYPQDTEDFMFDDSDKLIRFYKVYRAYVRGKVTSLMLKDKNIPEHKKIEARNTAQKYFALAHSYIVKKRLFKFLN